MGPCAADAPAHQCLRGSELAAASHQSAVPALHASFAHGTVMGPGGAPLPAQSSSQIQQPGAALWSTIPPLATQIGGPAPAVAVPNPTDAALAALFMSQLAAMQAVTQAAGLPQLTTPPPAYVAQLTEGAPTRQPCSTSKAAAALNRDKVWILYSPSTLGSHSPYPHILPPESATIHTRMLVMSAQASLRASLGHRCLAGLGRGKLGKGCVD